jgi:hypothetical protein
MNGDGSGSGVGESVCSSSRSRSNSLGLNKVLPSVTEHGELGCEDHPHHLPRPRGNGPEQQLLVGTDESGRDCQLK